VGGASPASRRAASGLEAAGTAALLPCGGDDLADDVRHDPGVVDLDVVAADEGDVPGGGHQPGQGVLRDIPGTVVGVAEVLRDECRQRAIRDRGRDDRSEVTGTGAGVTGHNRDGQPAGQRPSGAGLGHAGVEIEPFDGRVPGELPGGRAGDGLQDPPLPGGQRGLPLRRERIDEHQAGYLGGVLARVEPGDQAAVGVADQDIGARLAGGPQQGVQVADRVLGRGRLPDRGTAARRQVIADRGTRPVVGAHPGEPGHPGKHRQRGIGLVASPDIGRCIQAGYQHDRGRPGSPALQEHLAAAADTDQAGEVPPRRRWACRGDTAPPGEQDDGARDEHGRTKHADRRRSHDCGPPAVMLVWP
jgi:hypothetical protein